MFPNLPKFGSGFEHQSAYKQDIWKTFWRYPSGLYVFGKFFEQIVRARAVLKSFVFFSFQKIYFFVSSKSFPNILFIGTLMLKELPNFERLGNISKQLVITGRIGNFFWGKGAKIFGTIFGQKQDMSNPLGRTISRKLFRVTKSTAAVGMCSGDEESVEGRCVSNRTGITQPRADDLSSWQDKSSSRKAESQ